MNCLIAINMLVFKMKIKDTINNPDLKWWLNYLPDKISKKLLLSTNCHLPAHLFLTGKAVNRHSFEGKTIISRLL